MDFRESPLENLKSKKIIRLSKSSISIAEKNAVAAVLDKEFLGMGEEVQKFESLLKDYFKRDVVCVNTGTSALQLAIQSSGIGSGDEVLVPSLTYVASYQAISATGATPLSCDIDLENCFIDLSDAEKRITERTKAIMPVHYTGAVCDLEKVYGFAKRHNLRVIEDAAHAFGSKYRGKLVGSIGDITCFSFDGIKNITAGEGGCVISDDQELIRSVKDIRLLGVERDTESRFAGLRTWEFDVKEQGWRYHMSNIMAAIGIEQFKRFPIMAEKRRHLCQLYDSILKHQKRILIFKKDYSEIVPHIYPIRIIGLRNREKLTKKLLEYGIQTGIHYQPNHRLTFYRNDHELPLENTEKVYSELLTLPLHIDLTDDDVLYVSEILIKELSSITEY